MKTPNIFLYHYSSFQPLWNRDGIVQCGPNIKTGIAAVESNLNVLDLKAELNKNGFIPKGILIHYLDPFIIRAGALRGLSHWAAPKILVSGDLHHGKSPIETLIKYQTCEFHDSVVLAFNPMLLEKIKRYLNVPVHCHPPGFFCYPQRIRNSSPKKCLLHVGSIGPYHQKRREVIKLLLKRKRIPFFHQSTKNAEEAADLYNQYSLVLNIPLNNDLNHRFFEIISANTAQIIYGSKALLGPLKYLDSIPGVYWSSSIEELEENVRFLLSRKEVLTYPDKWITNLPINDFLLKSLSYS